MVKEKWKFMLEQKGYNLYLDDVRTPKKGVWKIVRSFEEFVAIIVTEGLPNEISFDHDLGEEHINYFFDNGGKENPPNPQKANFREKTGYDAAKWLVEFCYENGLPLPKYNVHSANPVGKQNILHLLDNYKKKEDFS